MQSCRRGFPGPGSYSGAYNEGDLRFLRHILLCLLCLAGAAAAQSRASLAAQTLLVLPFENRSKAPGLEWIGESFPEVLGQRMASPSLYAISREDRDYAFDRAGVPANLHLSRATLYHIAEDMDVDFVVLGRFNFDGQIFTAKAQLLDMKRLHLSPELTESGPLVKLIDVQTALAWDLLHTLAPTQAASREQFMAASPPIRLDAFENYVRGVIAPDRTERVRRFKEALRLNPNYSLAALQLGRTYYAQRDYDQAAQWFAKVPRSDPMGREASFYQGLSEYFGGDYPHAEEAFQFLATRLPLTEVYNNLGVVAARRGKRSELEYFQKAVEADASDPDYRFNLALALYKFNDSAGAVRQLREVLNLRPTDGEARSLLESLTQNVSASLHASAAAAPAAANGRLPLERVKRNYDETSFQQLELEIQNATELRLSKTDPHTHAAFHTERGHQMLESGFVGEAEKEFREAIMLDPTNIAAHSGLARVLLQTGDASAASAEADSALRLGQSAEALVVLGQLALNQGRPDQAQQNVDQALALDPNNAAAQGLKKAVDAKMAQKR